MYNGLRKSYWVSIFCAILVLALLIAVPIWAAVASADTGEVGQSTVASGTKPSSPAEAQQLFEQRDQAWPDENGNLSINTVQQGIQVSIPYDTVSGTTNHANSAVKVELDRGGIVQTVNTTTNANRLFTADLSTGDIQSGDTVRVTDMVDANSVDVVCTLTAAINTGNDTVTGTALAGRAVNAYIIIPSTYYCDIPPGAAHKATSGTNWTADFSGTLNLRRGDVVKVFATDANNNTVMTTANTGGSLVVYPQNNQVLGYYLPAVALNVKAGSATIDVGTAGDGGFLAWFTNHNIAAGEQVSCTMGTARSITVSAVSATYNMDSNIISGTGPANQEIRLTADVYGTPTVFQSQINSSGEYSVDLGAYEPEGNLVFNVAWYDADGDCVVYEFEPYTWFLAEGSTGGNESGNFETWVLVQNPSDSDANVQIAYMTEEGEVPGPPIVVGSNTRTSINVADTVPNTWSVSTKVTADQQVIVERSVYWNTPTVSRQAAHDSIGTQGPDDTWYLAEGSTGGNASGQFETWVLVQNPGDTAANVNITYMTETGEVAGPALTLAPNSRQSISVADTVPSTWSVSTKVTSDVNVIAERSVYWNTPTTYRQAAHDSIGVGGGGADTWYLAEGSTGGNASGNFETWVLVQNPGDTAATVQVNYMTETGEVTGPVLTLEPNTRQSVNVADTVPETWSVSTKITSDVPVIAERSVYWNTPAVNRQAAHDSIGVGSAGATTWYLAEGSTGWNPSGQFETWVLVQNPGDTAANVQISYMTEEGEVAGPAITLAPNSRQSINVADTVPTTWSVSTKVTSDVDVIAERSVYWNTPTVYRQAAHDSIGVR